METNLLLLNIFTLAVVCTLAYLVFRLIAKVSDIERALDIEELLRNQAQEEAASELLDLQTESMPEEEQLYDIGQEYISRRLENR